VKILSISQRHKAWLSREIRELVMRAQFTENDLVFGVLSSLKHVF